jgi:peptide deformylase
MILKVARMGHPVLAERAREVTDDERSSDALRRLVADMFDTMDEYEGIGLAAPQVHVSLRLLVLDLPAGLRDEGDPAVPRMAMLNPVVTPITSETMDNWEGCLSIPDLIGKVARPRAVRVRWTDVEGHPHEQVFEGFPAAAVQHEVDHLDGVLYVQRIQDLRTFQFTREFGRFHAGARGQEVEGEDV